MAQVVYTPTQDQIFTALRDFLVDIMPVGMPIRQGQLNKVAEPSPGDFIIFWLINTPRISTNEDFYSDGVFTGTIGGSTMNITAANPNFTQSLQVGSSIFGVNVAVGTKITALGSGTGGIGTYTVSPSQTVGSETLAAGVETLDQAFDYVVQVDVHGPNSIDNANTISTLFRDEYGVEFFVNTGFPVCPLYADDPVQVPFQNAEQQWETREIVTAHMQVNFTVTVPQQFFDEIDITLINTDTIPAS